MIVLFLISCKDGPTNNSGEAMVLHVDGETFTYGFDDLTGDCFWDSTAEIVTAKFRVRLNMPNTRKLTLNLNIWGSDVIGGVPGTFDIAEYTESGILRINVNIVDFNRATDQHLILRNGSITLHQWTEDYIHFSFEGHAGGMLDQKATVPVSGKVNMKCSKR